MFARLMPKLWLVFSYLFMSMTAYADDIELSLDKNLADKYLSEINYPYTHTITPKSFSLLDESIALDEAEVMLEPIVPGDFGFAQADADFGRELEEQIVDELMSPVPKTYVLGSNSEEARFFETLKSRMPDVLKTGDREKVRAKTAELLSADAGISKQFQALAKKWFKVDIRWIKIQIEKKPASQVSNPIELRDLKLGVKSELRVCVRVGKWRCTRYFTVGYVRLEGRRLAHI